MQIEPTIPTEQLQNKCEVNDENRRNNMGAVSCYTNTTPQNLLLNGEDDEKKHTHNYYILRCFDFYLF
jgi:hypothetical protein